MTPWVHDSVVVARERCWGDPGIMPDLAPSQQVRMQSTGGYRHQLPTPSAPPEHTIPPGSCQIPHGLNRIMPDRTTRCRLAWRRPSLSSGNAPVGWMPNLQHEKVSIAQQEACTAQHGQQQCEMPIRQEDSHWGDVNFPCRKSRIFQSLPKNRFQEQLGSAEFSTGL
jgi:hypothetical protein